MQTKQRAYFAGQVVKAGGETAELLISTEAVDREGDRLIATGAQLDSYLRNPVVLYAHDQRSIPVGRATDVRKIPGRGVRAAWRWLEGDPFADRVRNAWDQGVLNAASVGFLPREWDRNDAGGFDFTAWELLEFSIVPVPANPEAVRTLKVLGLSGFGTARSSDVRVEITPAQLERLTRRLAAEIRGWRFAPRRSAPLEVVDDRDDRPLKLIDERGDAFVIALEEHADAYGD